MVATPNHWHALAGIWACQAGKDAYIEKPMSYNIWEGRQVVAAATVLGDWQESLITVLQLAILAVCSWLLAIVAFVVQDVTLAPVSDRHGRQPTVAAGPHPGHLAAATGRQDQLRDHRSGSEAGSGRSPGCWFACHLSQYLVLAHFAERRDKPAWRRRWKSSTSKG